MLKIRQHQLDSLAQAKREQALREMAILLKTIYPSVFQYYSQAQMDIWVMRQVDRLGEYGIDSVESENNMLHLFALYGEDFERRDDASALLDILASTNYIAEEKVDRVVHILKLT